MLLNVFGMCALSKVILGVFTVLGVGSWQRTFITQVQSAAHILTRVHTLSSADHL